MKKLNINWDGIHDSTGYLFSFAKCLAALVKNSPYSIASEDIIATSGFAFRMWVNTTDLCPSATSIWDFDSQKTWVESGGFICDYVGRYWDQSDIEAERRLEAINIIRESIDRGLPAISWDVSGCEWGLITGYDDFISKFTILNISGDSGEIAYDSLGKLEIPILSVLTIIKRSDKAESDIITDTLKLCASHLKGEEWCENAKGLDAYLELIEFIKNKFVPSLSWNVEYYLGTFGELKYYAYIFFEKYKFTEIANLYKKVADNWEIAFKIKKKEDISNILIREKIIMLLSDAYKWETEALNLIEKILS